jgi:hypothetical protein
MKTHKFTFSNVTYTLTGLTANVKEEFMDPIRDALIQRAERMLERKRIDQAGYLRMEKEALKCGFHSEPCMDEIRTQEGMMRLVKIMLEPKEAVTQELLDALLAESQDLKSSFSKAVFAVQRDAFPNIKVPEGEQSDPKA